MHPKYWKKSGTFNTGTLKKVLEKSMQFVSLKKWEPCVHCHAHKYPPPFHVDIDLFPWKSFLHQGPFCWAIGALCFGLRMTLLSMSFKARMDLSSPALLCSLCVSVQWSPNWQCHLWLLVRNIQPVSLTCDERMIPLCQAIKNGKRSVWNFQASVLESVSFQDQHKNPHNVVSSHTPHYDSP